jgi:O-antigen ligase
LLRRWYPAVLTAAFVMAGFVKEAGYLAGVPFDLTLGLGVLTAVTVAARLSVSVVPRRIHGVVLAFALLIPPVFFVAATEYGSEKTLRLFAFTFLAVLAPVALIRDTADVVRHLCCLTAFAGIVVVTALVDPQSSSDYEGAPIITESVNTIQLGSAGGLVVLVLAVGLIWNRIPGLAIVPAAAGLYVLLQSGSRGPLFSTVVAVFTGVLLTRVRPAIHRIVIFGVLLAVGVVAAYGAAPEASRGRILGLLQGSTAGSVDARVSLYSDALDAIAAHPLGTGWGGFQAFAFRGYTYPHNIVLELLAEAGLVCGGFFLIWLCVQIVRAHRLTDNVVGAVVFAVVLFWVGKALVSGDINDNRVLFYALGMSIAARAVAAPGTHDLVDSVGEHQASRT